MTQGLTQALIQRREIKAPGGSFTVRGLSPADIFAIYARHTGELGLWFEKLQTQQLDISFEAAPTLVASLLDSAPILAAEIIAAACGQVGDEEAISIARDLSISVQVSALEAVGQLTFTEEMPPKKLLEIVVQMASQIAGPTESSPT